MTNISLAERRFLLYSVLTLALSLSAGTAAAKVSGVCGNCHTMHNSQDGAAVAHSGDGAGWAADGSFNAGAASETPIGYLLISDCVGCHSATSDQTIVQLGENRIPIVMNTAQYPTKPLAGGNFYQVSRGETYDGYGHNVYGISEIDGTLTSAPGNNRCGNAESCHNTLAVAPAGGNDYRGGCQGCHYSVYHHKDSTPYLADNTPYRFLTSHDERFGAWVEGVEHASWEHPDDTTLTEHNFYKGVDRNPNDGAESLELKQSHSISGYCAGCHNLFHSNAGIGINTWLRHPTDIALPEDGEYAQYNPVTAYEVQSPVAWVNPATPQRDEAIVMCLSCHRVHGSEHPDILRWDYSQIIAGEANEDGCFVCHTTKD
ncbi:MAG: cytochrome c3 family protein [Thermodesulfobacteriota bacterium]